jgi:hypothetical protein
MTALSALWLPIVLSAVAVFIVSAVIHMGPFWHRGDYPKVPREDEFMEALRPLGTPPGDYMVPRCYSAAEMKSPEFLGKLARGPVMIVTVLPNGMMSMARNLGAWLVYLLVVSLAAACIAGSVLPPGTPYMTVFKLVGMVSFLGYAAALWQMWIWYRRSLAMTLKSTFDALIYAGITAGILGWRWPVL